MTTRRHGQQRSYASVLTTPTPHASQCSDFRSLYPHSGPPEGEPQTVGYAKVTSRLSGKSHTSQPPQEAPQTQTTPSPNDHQGLPTTIPHVTQTPPYRTAQYFQFQRQNLVQVIFHQLGRIYFLQLLLQFNKAKALDGLDWEQVMLKCNECFMRNDYAGLRTQCRIAINFMSVVINNHAEIVPAQLRSSSGYITHETVMEEISEARSLISNAFGDIEHWNFVESLQPPQRPPTEEAPPISLSPNAPPFVPSSSVPPNDPHPTVVQHNPYLSPYQESEEGTTPRSPTTSAAWTITCPPSPSDPSSVAVV